MKLVTAIVQPQQLPAVKKALFEVGIEHLTCTNVIGTASEGVDILMFRGVPHEVTLSQKVRVELVLRDEMQAKAVEALKHGAKESGGFGAIFASELIEFINLQEDERTDQAHG